MKGHVASCKGEGRAGKGAAGRAVREMKGEHAPTLHLPPYAPPPHPHMCAEQVWQGDGVDDCSRRLRIQHPHLFPFPSPFSPSPSATGCPTCAIESCGKAMVLMKAAGACAYNTPTSSRSPPVPKPHLRCEQLRQGDGVDKGGCSRQTLTSLPLSHPHPSLFPSLQRPFKDPSKCPTAPNISPAH